MKFIVAFLLLTVSLSAQDDRRILFTGTVVDAKTGQGVSGASIRVVGTTMGTYAGGRGTFRLPLPPGSYTLQVRSIGYREVTQKIDVSTSLPLSISLPPSAVNARAVTVVGDITPEEVVKRASARRDSNARRIKTLERNLYSKLRLDLKNKGFAAAKDDDQGIITETFSRIYEHRMPEPAKKQTLILQRRQTKNFPAAANLAVFDEEFDFTADNFELLNVKLTTPLSPDAVKDYNFTIVNKRSLGDYLAYEMAFAPKSRLFPGFEGTMTIVDGSYQLVEASFAPTQETAFPFIKGFRIQVRYEQVLDSIWVPAFQELSGNLRIKVIAGLADIEVAASATSWLQDATANHVIPDTVFKRDTAGRSRVTVDSDGQSASATMTLPPSISVMPDADTAKSEYWEQHAFAELSLEEREVYRKQDSIAAADTTKAKQQTNRSGRRPTIGTYGFAVGPVDIGVTPVVNRTSVTGFMYGGQLEVGYGGVVASGTATYGDAETKAGTASIRASLLRERRRSIDVTASVFSNIYTVQQSSDIYALQQRFSNFDVGNLLFADYSDFYRRDGFDVGVRVEYHGIALAVLGEASRHFTMPLLESIGREQVTAVDGSYRTLFGTIGTAQQSGFAAFMGVTQPIAAAVTVGYGEDAATGMPFRSVFAMVGAQLNTFDVGYIPMRFEIYVDAGLASANTPRQYQFCALRRFPVLGGQADLMTPPVSRLGGTEFIEVFVDHNFTDLWWRAIGLPTYNGRGIDLIATGAAASYVQRGTPLATAFRSTGGWYTEAGVAFSRIPTFISDLAFLRVDMRWPVGAVAKPIGSFGWVIGVSSPLL